MSEVVAMVARLTLAAAFAFSAAAKVMRPATFTAGLAAFGVPAPRTAAYLLPPLEAGLAAVLVALPTRSWPALLAVGFLVLVTGAVVANLAAGRAVPCPCFDPAGERPVSTATVVRNGALLGLAIVATGSAEGAAAVPTAALSAVTMTITLIALRRYG